MTEVSWTTISPAEQDVLKVLWQHGPLPVRDVQEHLLQAGLGWSRSTVITLLQRLERKQCVASDRSRFAFVFRAVVTREQLMHARVQELAVELSDGQPLPLMTAFAEQHRFTAAEVQQLRELIDRLDRQRRKRGAP